jgi:hypothetical protein
MKLRYSQRYMRWRRPCELSMRKPGRTSVFRAERVTPREKIMVLCTAKIHRMSKRSPRQAARRSSKRPFKRSPRHSATRSPGRPAKRAPGRPAKRSPGRPAKRSPGRPAKRAPGRPAKRSPGRSRARARGSPRGGARKVTFAPGTRDLGEMCWETGGRRPALDDPIGGVTGHKRCHGKRNVSGQPTPKLWWDGCCRPAGFTLPRQDAVSPRRLQQRAAARRRPSRSRRKSPSPKRRKTHRT